MNNRIEIRPGRLINLSIYQHPTSDKTAFLIHGLGGRGEQWRFQLDMLKEKYTLIIPDLYGNGQSDKPKQCHGTTNPYSFIEYDLDLRSLFNRYASDENIIIGHSYGGTLATSLTVGFQDKVSKLILISPTACAPGIDIPFIYRLPAFALDLLRPIMERKFQRDAFDPLTNADLVAEEMKANKANPMYVIADMIIGMNDINKVDIAKMTLPTLMLTGEHDKLIPPIVSTGFYSALPHHQFHVIKQAAHLGHLEQVEAVNGLIRKFLE